MNKKKRALALGLAAAQLTSLSAVVAPLTAFAEVDNVTLPTVTNADGYTIKAEEGTDDKNGSIVITVEIAKGYAAGKTSPTSETNSTLEFTETKDGDKVTGWTTDFTAPANSDEAVDLSDLKVPVLQIITPTISLPQGVKGVTFADKTEAEDTDHASAIAEAEKIAFVVESGVDNLELTKDTDYTIKCEWVDGSDDAAGSIKATLELTDDAKEKYALSSEDPVNVSIPVEYKTEEEEEKTALTISIPEEIDLGELESEPEDADAIIKLIENSGDFKIEFTANDTEVILTEDDYSVEITASKTEDGKYSATITLNQTDAVKTYSLAEADATAEFAVKYTVKEDTRTAITVEFTKVELDVFTKIPTDAELKAAVEAALAPTFKNGKDMIDDLTKDDYTITTAYDSETKKWSAAVELKNSEKYKIEEADAAAEFEVDYNIVVTAAVDSGKTLTVTAEQDKIQTEAAKLLEGDKLSELINVTAGTDAVTSGYSVALKSAEPADDTDNKKLTYTAVVTLTDTLYTFKTDDTKTTTFDVEIEITYTVLTLDELTVTGGTPEALDLTENYSKAQFDKLTDEQKQIALDGAKTQAKAAFTVKNGEDAVEVDDTDFAVSIDDFRKNGDIWVVNATLSLTDAGKLKYKFASDTHLIVEVPVTFASEYTVSGTCSDEHVEVAVSPAAAAVNDEVTITVTGETGYSVKTAPTLGADTFTREEDGSWTLKKVIAKSDITGEEGSEKIEFAVTAAAIPQVTVTTSAVTVDTALAKTTIESAALDHDDEEAILTAVAAALEFSITDETLTRDTDYTLVVKTFTKGSTTAVVTVSPKGGNYDLTEADIDVTVTFAKVELTAPSVKAGNAATPAHIPAKSDADTIKDLLLAQIENISDKIEFDITVAGTDDIAGANEADPTAKDATLTIAIKAADQANYEFDDADNKTSITLTVKFDIAEEATAITPALATKAGSETVYVNTAPTVENIKTALGADGITLTITGTDPDNAPTLIDGDDYELTYAYDSGTLTVSFELLNKVAYRLSSDANATTATVTVKQVLAALPTVADQSFEKDAADASETIKTAVVAALKTAWGDEIGAAATVTVGAVDVTAAIAEKTVDVTVAVSGIYVLDNTGGTSGTITVKYAVTETEVPETGNTITITAPTNGTVTANKEKAEKDATVTLTITPAAGYVLDTLTVTGIGGNVTPTIAADKKSATFIMPDEAVTVAATFKTETSYNINNGTISNGTVSFTVGGKAATAAKKGETVTIVASPNSGYTRGTITVKDAAGSTVAVTGTTFVMPESAVTVTVAFNKTSSSGGSSRPSGGSNGYTSITEDINDANNGSAVSAPYGTTILSSAQLKTAAEKDLTLEIPVNSTYTWNFKPGEMESTDSYALLNITDGGEVSSSEAAKIEGKPVSDIMTFETKADGLGKSATLTVTTAARPTDAQPKFANLYRIKDDGTLEFVKTARVANDGKAILPISEMGRYAVMISDETKQPGDINNDCVVKLDDVQAALRIYVNAANTINRAQDFKLDHDGSGVVGMADIQALLRDWAYGRFD